MKKTQEIKDLRIKDKKALYKELESLNSKLVELNTSATFRKLKNIQSIGQTRRRIAWVWTILTEKAMAEVTKEENYDK